MRSPAPRPIIDVTRAGFDGRLLSLFLRQSQGQDQADSMDFAFFPSLRASDAAMLLSYSLGAYRLTGDESFLKWRDQVLIAKANAREVSRTEGAFQPPVACSGFYRTPNVYLAHFARLMTEGEGGSLSFARDIWKRKFALKEMAPLDDPLFEVLYAGSMGVRGARADSALQQLAGFGGTEAVPDSPRRNYALDSTSRLPPGITAAPASAADVALCESGVTLFGVHISGPTVDRSVLYTDHALPAMLRPPDNWQWEKSPFEPRRAPGDAGRQQYAGLDLVEPYWAARYFGLLPANHLVLAWGPQ